MSDFYFACRKLNLLAIDGEGGVNSAPTTHTFFSRTVCAVILSLTSRNHARLKAQESRSTLLVSCPKTVTLHRAMSYVTPHLVTQSTGTPSFSPTQSSSHASTSLRAQTLREIYGHIWVALWLSPDPLQGERATINCVCSCMGAEAPTSKVDACEACG